MPEGHRFQFLTENADPQALHEWIKTQSTDLQLSAGDLTGTGTNGRWGLIFACKTQLNNIRTWVAGALNGGTPEAWDWQSTQLEAIICASLMIRSPDLFEMAITLDPRLLPLTKWERVGSTMKLAGFWSYRNP